MLIVDGGAGLFTLPPLYASKDQTRCQYRRRLRQTHFPDIKNEREPTTSQGWYEIFSLSSLHEPSPPERWPATSRVSACFVVSLTPRPHHACSSTRVGANKQLCGLPTAQDSPSGMAFLCTTCRKLELCCNFGHRRASRGSSCALKSNPFAVAPVPRAQDPEVILYSCEYNSMP